MVDKKKYTGQMMWLNSKDVNILFSKGLEDVKKNTIKITKIAIIELIKKITFEKQDKNKIIEWLEKLKKRVLTSDKITKEDIVISTRISKPTYKYVSKPVHVILAERLINEKKLLQPSEGNDAWGTRITYIITETYPKQQAIEVNEFNGKWDKLHYWNVLIYAPINRVLQTVWPEHDWQSYLEERPEIREKKLEKERKRIEKEIKNAELQQQREKRKQEREQRKKEKENKKVKKY
jgi:DNA polymerase elongation subunit (family B)